MKQSIDGFWMIYLLQLISTIVILFELISHSITSDSDEVDPESSIELQQEIINVSVDPQSWYEIIMNFPLPI